MCSGLSVQSLNTTDQGDIDQGERGETAHQEPYVQIRNAIHPENLLSANYEVSTFIFGK